MVNRGASLEARNKEDYTPLLKATFNGHREICEFLVQNGSNIEVTDLNNMTPLFYSSDHYKKLEIFQLLVKKGADLNRRAGKNSITILQKASLHGCYEIVRILLVGIGNNYNNTASDQNAALELAKSKGHSKIVTILKAYV